MDWITQVLKSITAWLSWSGWAGIAALAAVIAVIAVVVAVANFFSDRQDPEGAFLLFVRHVKTNSDGSNDIQFRAKARVDTIAYSPEVRVWDARIVRSWPSTDLVDVSSPELTARIRVEKADEGRARVGIQFIRKSRHRSSAGGVRVFTQPPSGLQVWTAYQWFRWPRKHAGKWVTLKSDDKRLLPMSPPD